MEILLDRISHFYGPSPVLQGINLRIESGEIVAVLGPSGCGKSTLLRLVGGLERPTSGSIQTRSVSEHGSRAIAYVFQDPTLLPWRTLEANVSLPLESRDMPHPERKERVADALARVDLIDFAGSYPKHLSGGMRQRASVARALVVKPEVLLMDEPLASLDAEARDMLMADLIRLWGESRYTCIYVTHSPSEAVRIGHRVVVLSARPGSIREVISIRAPLSERSETHPELLNARDHIQRLARTFEAPDNAVHVD